MGSLGLGGGTVLIIYLTNFKKIPQINAQGINLLFFIPCAIVSVIFHSKHRLIKWKIALFIILGGVFGTLIGAEITVFINPMYIKKIFGFLLIYMGIKELR